MEIEKEQRRSKIRACVSQANDLAFLMVVVCAEVFNTFGKLVAFEDALNKHLWHLQTADVGSKSCKEACLLGWFKSGCLSPGAGACAQQCAGYQALELMLVGQAVALEALEVMVLVLSSTLG